MSCGLRCLLVSSIIEHCPCLLHVTSWLGRKGWARETGSPPHASCCLRWNDSQAAYLTGGVYLKPSKPVALVQYLNVSCRYHHCCRYCCCRLPPPVPAWQLLGAAITCAFLGCPTRPCLPQSVFAVDAATRQFLRMPGTAHVDFRASCFCHKRQIDLGWGCLRGAGASLLLRGPAAAASNSTLLPLRGA